MIDFLNLYFLLVLGAAWGSFSNVVIYRMPRGLSIVKPRSFCPNCSTPIKAWHNIPIFSWIFLKGKCAYCQTPINSRYVFVELLGAAIFCGLYLVFRAPYDGSTPSMIHLSVPMLKYIVLFAVCLPIVLIDLEHMLIPDKLSLPLIVLGFVFCFLPGTDVSWRPALYGAVAGFVAFYLVAWLFYKAKGTMGLGGGDIKLITALAAFTGIPGLMFTVLAGSIIALAYFLTNPRSMDKPIPFGPFLVAGCLGYVLAGNILVSTYLSLFR